MKEILKCDLRSMPWCMFVMLRLLESLDESFWEVTSHTCSFSFSKSKFVCTLGPAKLDNITSAKNIKTRRLFELIRKPKIWTLRLKIWSRCMLYRSLTTSWRQDISIDCTKRLRLTAFLYRQLRTGPLTRPVIFHFYRAKSVHTNLYANYVLNTMAFSWRRLLKTNQIIIALQWLGLRVY